MSLPLHANAHLGRTCTEAGSSTFAASLLATSLVFPCALLAWAATIFLGMSHDLFMTMLQAAAAILITGFTAGIVLLTTGHLLAPR